VFAADQYELGTLRLIAATGDESAALAQLNRFRGRARRNRPLRCSHKIGLDEESDGERALLGTAKKFAAGRIGHTCGALGNRAEIVEVRSYSTRSQERRQDWSPAQKRAAFDATSSGPTRIVIC